MVDHWRRRLADLLFPHRCVLCNAPGAGGLDLCTRCRAGLPANGRGCARCALPLPEAVPAGSLCGRCLRHPPPYQRLQAPWLYRETAAELVRLLKFRHRLAAGRVLGMLLAEALEVEPDPPELLLPVPLHARHLRERGFNHAAEITRGLSRALGIPWSSRRLLKRRLTAPQHGLGRRERLKNLRGAFCFREGAAVAHAAIVDDVVTTGATAAEIARLLRSRGVERVSIWAVARTPAEDG